MENQILEVLSMFLLSLWKVYIAYGYFAFESYNFITAVLIISIAVVSANLICKILYNKIQYAPWFIKFKTSKGYLKGEHFYNKYGFYPSMLLAPTLLGIPTITLVSLTMNVNNKKTVIGLLVSNVFWGLIIYLSLHYSLELFSFNS